DSGVDVLMGIGGTPEGVISACALKCMGGEIQGKIHPRNDDEGKRGKDAGYDLKKVFTMDDLVANDNVFFAATGITDGELLDGVQYYGSGARTHSLVMRSKSGTVREIIARHRLDKLQTFSSIAYD
ncbi:MAG: fructose-bisphosphatase class II, partial [Chloroflexi bacterium]|nr:fructose-bisphosphatase class II [Chloroflexota bacterium]